MENDKIKELKKQIAEEEKKMQYCSHSFGESYSDYEKTSEPYGSVLVGQGSDHWHQPEGWREVFKPRWARKCSKCGGIQYTYKQKAIVKSHEPDFN